MVAQLIFERLTAMHRSAFIHYWHHITLELVKYLTFKKI